MKSMFKDNVHLFDIFFVGFSQVLVFVVLYCLFGKVIISYFIITLFLFIFLYVFWPFFLFAFQNSIYASIFLSSFIVLTLIVFTIKVRGVFGLFIHLFLFVVVISKDIISLYLGQNKEQSVLTKNEFFHSLKSDLQIIESHFKKDLPLFDRLRSINQSIALLYMLLFIFSAFLKGWAVLLPTFLMMYYMFNICNILLVTLFVVFFLNPPVAQKTVATCAIVAGVCMIGGLTFHAQATSPGIEPIDSPVTRAYQKYKLGFTYTSLKHRYMADVYYISLGKKPPINADGSLNLPLIRSELGQKGQDLAINTGKSVLFEKRAQTYSKGEKKSGWF